MNHDDFELLCDLCDKYSGRPWDGSHEQLAEALARQRESTEVLESHAEWLSDVRSRVLDSGTDWDHLSCCAQSRRDGDLAAPPEWIARMSAGLTPDRLLNR